MGDFEAGDYTGPIRPPNIVMEQWYHRFKDVANALHRQGHAIGCNPKDKGLVKESVERLQEDETWPHGREIPPVVVTSRIRAGQIMAVDQDTLRQLTLAQAMRARTGFGRFRGLWTPGRDGISNPWSLRGVAGREIRKPKSDEERFYQSSS